MLEVLINMMDSDSLLKLIDKIDIECEELVLSINKSDDSYDKTVQYVRYNDLLNIRESITEELNIRW